MRHWRGRVVRRRAQVQGRRDQRRRLHVLTVLLLSFGHGDACSSCNMSLVLYSTCADIFATRGSHCVADASVGHSSRVSSRFMCVAANQNHPSISASVNGFSSFAYSLRAARSRCAILTGSPSSAARNAALKRDVPDVAARHVEARQQPRESTTVESASALGKDAAPDLGALLASGKRELHHEADAGGGMPCRARCCMFVVRIASPRYASIRCSR